MTSFAIVLLLICCSVSIGSFAIESAPTWFKEGIYAEYGFNSGSIWFINGTFYSFPEKSHAKATFRWQCLYITKDNGRLNITLSFSHETIDFWFSTLLDVNFETRRVKLLNETYAGMTFLWLPPNLVENQTITVTDGVIGNVTMIGLASAPQELQEAFWTVGTGEFAGYLIAPNGGYDLDTGLLLQSGFWGEPALIALGILDPGVVGQTEFTATNIDLGPGKPKLTGTQGIPLESLLVAIPIGMFALTFLIIIKRRKLRRRKGTRNKRLRTNLIMLAQTVRNHFHFEQVNQTLNPQIRKINETTVQKKMTAALSPELKQRLQMSGCFKENRLLAKGIALCFRLERMKTLNAC